MSPPLVFLSSPRHTRSRWGRLGRDGIFRGFCLVNETAQNIARGYRTRHRRRGRRGGREGGGEEPGAGRLADGRERPAEGPVGAEASVPHHARGAQQADAGGARGRRVQARGAGGGAGRVPARHHHARGLGRAAEPGLGLPHPAGALHRREPAGLGGLPEEAGGAAADPEHPGGAAQGRGQD